MSRIDVFQEKYPTVPREVIVKWDTLNKGIRHSAALDKVQGGRRRLPTYQSYDHDVTLKQMADQTANALPPDRFFLKNGQTVFLQRDAHSPYEIRELSPNRFFLCEGEEKVDEIYFVDRKRHAQEPVTSKGTPVQDLVQTNRICFAISAVRYCEYFAHGEECKFCDFNPSQEDARSVGIGRRVAVDLDDTLEAYRLLSSEVRFVEGGNEMGAFRDREQEVKIHASFIERLATAASYKPSLRLVTQPMGRKDYQRLKDAGLDCMTHQMEVWDRDLFHEIVPGKAKYTGYDGYLEGYLNAVDVFGAGNVRGTIVGGVTLMPANGHKSWQDSRDSLIDGMRWMIQHGILGSFISLRLRPASVYGRDPANRDKLPPTEYYLDAAVAHDQAMEEVGLYDKLCKFLVCPMCAMGLAYGGEVGILKRAGNYGDWLADVVPAESNWLARLVSTASSAT